MPGKTSVS